MQKLKSYAKQAFRALAYIHSMGIIHADIKLANLSLHKKSDDSEILKIIDFGLSLVTEENEEHKAHLNGRVGTVGYMAPELSDNSDLKVGPEIDIWSMGICLYKMWVAYTPDKVKKYHYGKFDQTRDKSDSLCLGTGPIPFVQRDWKKITPEFQSLIKCCLEFEPGNRISAQDALNHEALN